MLRYRPIGKAWALGLARARGGRIDFMDIPGMVIAERELYCL
jgi:hypothetical protein